MTIWQFLVFIYLFSLVPCLIRHLCQASQHTRISHAGLLHKGQASGAAIHSAVTAKKCIFHSVPPRGFRKSLCFFQLIKSHKITPYLLQRALLLSDAHSHNITALRLEKNSQKKSLFNRSRPRSRLNTILDSLKLLPSPFSLTSCTVRKTMDSFSICVKLLI